ncbi:HlyD family efflux transporter periplasmic adaptor subunit, partial [Lentzea sp. NPDC006480]|uniref:efflux RND transporter periplasmic adaptor subunit n=1 Tax=Lentzea sp. NPDC006480 TaxID=3157176 RepID=UPI0033BEE354
VGQKVGASSNASSNTSSTTSTTTTQSGFVVVTDLKNLVLHANVSESDVSKLKGDQAATVTVNAMQTQPIQAKVAQVDLTPTTSNNVVQYGVTLALTSPPEGLRPGQSASVEITVAGATNVLAVPAAAVQTVNGASSVQVMENGAETRKTVEIGVRGDQYVEIKSGLTAGEEVVLPPVTTSTNQNRTGQQQGGQFPGTGTGNRNGGGFTGTGR